MASVRLPLRAFIFLVIYTFVRVTGITMTVTPSSNTLVEGQSVRIQCSESNLPSDILLIELRRNDERMFSYSNTNEPIWDTSYTGPDYRTRAVLTGSVTGSAASLEFFINNTMCADSAVFYCKAITPSSSPETPTQNITVYGVIDYPIMSGGQECTSFDPGCDKCTPDHPFAPRPKYIRRGEMLELVCSGKVGLPMTSNSYRWYKQTERDSIRMEITENITTVIYEPTTSCSTNGRSTLRYYHAELDAVLVLTCEVTYDNRFISGGGVMTRGANTSVCIEETDECQGPNCPVVCITCKTDVENITDTTAIVLLDVTDIPGYPEARGWRLQCEDTFTQGIDIELEIERKDKDFGNGTIRLTLEGLAHGREYRCVASSLVTSGTGWTDSFSIRTQPRSAPGKVPITSPTKSLRITEYRLTWTAPETHGWPILAYHLNLSNRNKSVYIDTNTASHVRSYLFMGLTPGSRYNVSIVAENKFGRSTAAFILVTTLREPERVRITSPTMSTGDRYTVTWTEPYDHGSPIYRYDVKLSELQGTVTQMFSLSGQSRSQTFYGLSPSRNYRVSVVAVNQAGESEPTFVVISTFAVTTTTEPIIPDAAPIKWHHVAALPAIGGLVALGFLLALHMRNR